MSLSDSSFSDALSKVLDIHDLLSDDSDDDDSLGCILQKVLDIEATIGGVDDDSLFGSDNEDDDDGCEPPELDLRYDMEPEITLNYHKDENKQPHPVNWQKRFMLLEEEDRGILPILATE
mmetsp:Transcript_28928/g.43686  ORF Transcript_28928/g.43686 Transcript_28928/m.43686 type:complete len:120 (+) Transcript_28928:148-507(+)|eukprot:CAMPEP_0178920816 /NCGR_PEP_ID=MMETSP0786-20121207/15209_1 /TAXON_ID=186022 /ORGANISM="Thalassionema frauenfeldii, Strain CCMP 1798" /LENGTH=119 /DNA_ID=CAMNT_0020594913 /DNA_START=62 /DNA_END=421 /DNA_ORIENTATION=-